MILRRGGSLRHDLREWFVEAIDWRNTFASGHTKEYKYRERTDDIDEVLGNMGGILETIGIDALRVEPHTRGD
jgi:hypothetical protein